MKKLVNQYSVCFYRLSKRLLRSSSLIPKDSSCLNLRGNYSTRTRQPPSKSFSRRTASNLLQWSFGQPLQWARRGKTLESSLVQAQNASRIFLGHNKNFLLPLTTLIMLPQKLLMRVGRWSLLNSVSQCNFQWVHSHWKCLLRWTLCQTLPPSLLLFLGQFQHLLQKNDSFLVEQRHLT